MARGRDTGWIKGIALLSNTVSKCGRINGRWFIILSGLDCSDSTYQYSPVTYKLFVIWYYIDGIKYPKGAMGIT